jgi:hypothetical protein
MTVHQSHIEQDFITDHAKECRRMIKQTLDCCTDPVVCLSCREKLNEWVDALLHLPETRIEFSIKRSPR